MCINHNLGVGGGGDAHKPQLLAVGWGEVSINHNFGGRGGGGVSISHNVWGAGGKCP